MEDFELLPGVFVRILCTPCVGVNGLDSPGAAAFIFSGVTGVAGNGWVLFTFLLDSFAFSAPFFFLEVVAGQPAWSCKLADANEAAPVDRRRVSRRCDWWRHAVSIRCVVRARRIILGRDGWVWR
jgi:hypothetical protein